MLKENISYYAHLKLRIVGAKKKKRIAGAKQNYSHLKVIPF
jgi:hypothetical protein